ncbi:hypothetical protein POM88_028219 [Heracleum sosnowskyi]|uniref:Uncharacterized protein n=1 Tax=Heracleum sosnowskyi TaxID=360622 RepID=A0AAD8ICK5_9APIA|nr:hypothetical protein POM88_028219 [Heracleum sosnowskyi]
MSVLSWNCRGVGLPWNIQFLTHVIRQKKPTLIFLCETVIRRSKMEWLQRRLGYEGLFVVDPIGRSGGLALLWKEKEQAKLISYSKNHIAVQVCVEDIRSLSATHRFCITIMASSSSSQRPQIVLNPAKKFVEGNIGMKLRRSSVMLSLGGKRWSGTIVGQKSGKTVVLTVSQMFESWMSWEQIQSEMRVEFYEDREGRYDCMIELVDPGSDIALIVVNKSTTVDYKLSFAPENERDLKPLSILGCRGHEWRIATGKVCFPWIVNDRTQRELGRYSLGMGCFGHKLDTGGMGYVGAALVNEKGNFVGMQTAQSLESRTKYAIHVKYLHDTLKERLKVNGPTIRSLEKALEDLIGYMLTRNLSRPLQCKESLERCSQGCSYYYSTFKLNAFTSEGLAKSNRLMSLICLDNPGRLPVTFLARNLLIFWLFRFCYDLPSNQSDQSCDSEGIRKKIVEFHLSTSFESPSLTMTPVRSTLLKHWEVDEICMFDADLEFSDHSVPDHTRQNRKAEDTSFESPGLHIIHIATEMAPVAENLMASAEYIPEHLHYRAPKCVHYDGLHVELFSFNHSGTPNSRLQ